MEDKFVNINLRLLRSDYELLKGCKKDTNLTVTQMISMAVHKYLYPDNYVQPELKPLENLKNPVLSTDVKKPLEIPIPEVSSVVESASLVREFGRKVKPELYDVIKARRARDAGRDYDKSLEPFFNEING